MEIRGVPFRTIEWPLVEPSLHAGDPGTASWRTVEAGNVRVRVVEYSPGYVADHWCERGHVIHVLEGELVTELRDGRTFTLGPGQSYVVADGDGAHRSRAPGGTPLHRGLAAHGPPLQAVSVGAHVHSPPTHAHVRPAVLLK
jgi:mannose-6-phosphate isomerase-like protein (cupin superfamily)